MGMTPWEERDNQLIRLIKREIDKLNNKRERYNYHADSIDDLLIKHEIIGMVQILKLLDPNAMAWYPK